MANKTRQYTVILEDGSILYRVWGGNASSLRVAVENDGYVPTAIFHNKINPAWVSDEGVVWK